MVSHTPLQQFKEAKQIARDHGMYVVEKSGVYMVFRKTPAQNVFLGKRSSASGLRQFVAKCASFH
ncbi:MAG: hypothetical protein H6R18_1918 [Proteobacteria bacterium]|nr:hypothetical protein [Pseudomonadota bacterium]